MPALSPLPDSAYGDEPYLATTVIKRRYRFRVTPKTYVAFGIVIGLLFFSIFTTQATAVALNRALADQAAKDRKYNERKSLQDTINAQTIKLLEEQQGEIDALKKARK